MVRIVAQRTAASITAKAADVIWLPRRYYHYFFSSSRERPRFVFYTDSWLATKNKPRQREKNKLNKKLLESGARTLRGLAVNTAERALACNYCAMEARILRLI